MLESLGKHNSGGNCAIMYLDLTRVYITAGRGVSNHEQKKLLDDISLKIVEHFPPKR